MAARLQQCHPFPVLLDSNRSAQGPSSCTLGRVVELGDCVGLSDSVFGFGAFQGSGRLPRPSYVVPSWVAYYDPLPKNHNRPKKELHQSSWVELRVFSKYQPLVTVAQYRLRSPTFGTPQLSSHDATIGLDALSSTYGRY